MMTMRHAMNENTLSAGRITARTYVASSQATQWSDD